MGIIRSLETLGVVRKSSFAVYAKHRSDSIASPPILLHPNIRDFGFDSLFIRVSTCFSPSGKAD